MQVIKKGNSSLGLNEELANLMGKLSSIMAKKGDQIRARVYKKAEESIMLYPDKITDIEQLKNEKGIGKTIMEKLKEYIETGTLAIIEREKENPENIFNEIYGVGPKKAKEIVEKGIVSIKQLREQQREVLNEVQKIGLKYYEDILERIPRNEIDEYDKIFNDNFKKVADDASHYEIVGSYRRGMQTSGDIDVIITSKDNKVFNQFIDLLKEQKIIIEVLSRGKTKSLLITKLPNSKYARRVDFLYTSQEEYPFSVLYFTGSKTFNTVMRGHALKQGYTLNEHGIHKLVDKKKEEKVEHKFNNEKDIFDFLNLEYKEPRDRIDGRSVVIKTVLSSQQKVEEREPKKKTIKNREPKPPKVKTVKIREPKPPKEPKVKTMKIREPKPPKEPKVKTMKIRQPKPPKEPKVKTVKNREPNPPKEPKVKTIKIREPKVKKEKLIEPKENKEKVTKESKEDKMKANKETLVLLENFKENGINVLENLTEKELSNILIVTNEYYYNTKTALLTDNEYDIIKEYVEKKYPKNEVIEQVGAPVGKNKVTLPYEMASMDKIKPDTNILINWMKKYNGPYNISCKLDGLSGLYSTEGDKPKLYTRGDGRVGQDISHLLPTLNLPQEKGIVVRGEFIIPKKVFDEKYKKDFANPRNLASGIINSKSVDLKAKDIHFVGYEVIKPSLIPSEQMKLLKELKHEVVQHKNLTELSNDTLSEILVDWRKNYEYEIDGVIVTDDKIYPRKSGNPEHAFAFKMVLSDQIAEAKVVDVLWTPSKNGYLKPRVRIEPVSLGGVTIEYATGFNGKFIEDNKIGIGAIIQIIRSGDVIPHIKSVTVQAEKAKMPNVEYKWTDTHVDIILENLLEDITVRQKNITGFFVGLEVDGLSSGNVKRLMTAGYDSIPKILKMDKTDFGKVEGFKTKLTEKIYNGIQEKVNNASLLQIMASSNILGRGLGERKIKPILEKFPNILTTKESHEEKITMLKTINGIGKENAETFVSNISAFLEFLKECNLEKKLNNLPLENKLRTEDNNVDKTHPLYEKHVVMTKVRDKIIIERLQKVGGILDDNIGSKTNYLIVKSKDDISNKVKYAREHNIPIMTPSEFIEEFFK